MKIDRFEIVDRCLFLKKEKILIVGDLHLGYESVLRDKGMDIPKNQMREVLKIFGRIFKGTGKIKEIILLGDVKHEIGGKLKWEGEDFLNLVELFRKNLYKNGRVIITKGNHDNFLAPIVENYDDVFLEDYFLLDDILFFHGDRFSKQKLSENVLEKSKLLVIGHIHPAIEIVEDFKKEKYKCFLFGKSRYFKKELIIFPSFFPLVEGTNILKRTRPGFIEGLDIRNFDVFVLDSEGSTYDFGKVKKFL